MIGERGSMTPLIAGLTALVISLVLVVVSATSLLIDRHRLHSLAEATALHASESFDPATLRMGSGELVVPLTSARVRAGAVDYLRAMPPGLRLDDLTLVSADTPDGRRARVRLAATWRPPVVSLYVPLSVRLSAEAYSRSIIR
jgi:hypothetical protein